jgi:hypothetical protein
MALGQLIKFNASGIEHGTQLNPNIPTDVNNGKQYALRRMRKHNKVPTKASAQTVINAAKIASHMETNVERVAKVVGYRENEIEQALKLLEINVAHAGKMHGYSEKYQNLLAKYSKGQLQHQENSGVIQAQNEGVYQAFAGNSSFDSLRA